MELEPAIQKAEERIEYLSSDQETLNIYYERERALHERANMISSAEQRGREEERVLTIKKMISRGMDEVEIANILGINLNEIIKVKETME